MAGSPRLSMRGVRKRFGATVALAGVDLDIDKGRVLALIGENGAGKSTLMKILSGAERADAGAMTLDGEPYAPRGPMDARRRGVAMIYQELSLCPHLTVAENVLLGLEPATLGVVRAGEARARVADALKRLGHNDIDPSGLVSRLSPARRQVVEIARAVAVGCGTLVLDEPTSSLSRRDVTRLFELIDTLKAQGRSVIYISHFIEEVRRVADRYTVLRDGATVGGGAMRDATAESLVSLMVGREVRELYPRSRRTPGEEVLRVNGLGGVARPRGASLSLRRGEVLGVAGLVGAGRTELLRCIFGLDPVRAGTVRIGALDAGVLTPARSWSRGMGMVSEDRKAEGLALSRTIADNITLTRQPTACLPGPLWRAAGAWITALNVKCKGPWQRVGELSGGNQQKVALARLLHHGADLWLLDEPTRGIDIGSKAEIYRLIDELARGTLTPGAGPAAVLWVGSYLPELLGVCDRIAVMRRGELGVARAVGEWDAPSLLAEAIDTGAALS